VEETARLFLLGHYERVAPWLREEQHQQVQEYTLHLGGRELLTEDEG